MGRLAKGLSSIGEGQTWKNVTASRVIGTTYYNTTGRSIVFFLKNIVYCFHFGSTKNDAKAMIHE